MPFPAADFESAVSAIPPLGRGRLARTARNGSASSCHFGTIPDVVQFVVGIVVGASAAALLMILIAPSRRVRSEPPLEREAETRLLLGMDPEQPTIPPEPRPDHPRQYTPTELAALQRLGHEQQQRRRKR